MGINFRVVFGYKLNEEASSFLSFLKSIGKKYSVKVRYKTLKLGEICISVNAEPTSKIALLIQELILNRGLYYYLSAKSYRNLIERQIIRPICIGIIEELGLPVTYEKFLKRHALGKLPQSKFVPGWFNEKFAHEYEILFRKWEFEIIDDWNFIRDLDSLITNFLLEKLGHKPGEKSQKFDLLLESACKRGLGMDDEFKSYFRKIHKARTLGLHRLKFLDHEELSDCAIRIYSYFQYFDEFRESQKLKMDKLHGRRYKRFKYGYEKWESDDPELKTLYFNWRKSASEKPCHDCAAIVGQYHAYGCDMEQCPRCREQFLSCGCKLESDLGNESSLNLRETTGAA